MKKTDEEIAYEVIQGKWGVNDDRIVRLTNAGYNASKIQKLVNQILKEQMADTGTATGDEPKQILEVEVDLKKYGALMLKFTGE